MKHTIRFLQETDSAAYRALRLYSLQESPFAFSNSYEDEMHKDVSAFASTLNPDSGNSFVLGAFNEEDALIGFVTFKRDERSLARHKSMLHAMYVHPDCRSTGIGGELMRQLIVLAKKMDGLEQIHLWVLHAEGAVSASAFYQKIGFKSQGTRVEKDLKIKGRYVDAEYMVMYW